MKKKIVIIGGGIGGLSAGIYALRSGYDAVIYEGEHMSSYRLRGVTKAKQHILRQHDIESNYRWELSKSASSLGYKCGQIFEALLYKKLEKRVDRYFDVALFISKEEKEEFDQKYPGTSCNFVFMPPATLQFAPKLASGQRKNEILYFGNMELQNNVLSILWFVREVFPRIAKRNPEARLKIIGKVSEENKTKLLENTKNIEVLGYVDDLAEEIDRAAMIASPVLFGAGVKVKVIDALSYGQIVCATRKTIEGTELVPGRHLIVEDDPEKLAAECVRVLKDRGAYAQMAFEGWNYVKKYHSIEYQASVLDSVPRVSASSAS